jgi:hypothetical protein
MTREELDTLWNRSVNQSIKAGDSYARYRYAEYVAALAVAAEREACKKLSQEHAAEYRVGGRLYAPLGENYALCAATACDHIVHLIEERGSK